MKCAFCYSIGHFKRPRVLLYGPCGVLLSPLQEHNHRRRWTLPPTSRHTPCATVDGQRHTESRHLPDDPYAGGNVQRGSDKRILEKGYMLINGEEITDIHTPQMGHRAVTRPLVSALAFVGGIFILPLLTAVLSPLIVPRGADQVDTVITGGFMPLVGILFAMLSSTGVAALRQRQQDLRDLLHQELALIRMLLVMIKDESIIKLLLKYTLELESETFSHQKNGISYDHEVPGTAAAIRREEAFAASEETLWKCFGIANDLRLRPEVEAAIRNLVTFRTKRRAVLDSGLPQIHLVITTLLGVAMLLAFGMLVANDVKLLDVVASRLLFGALLALLSLTYALIADLRDPFGGDYGVTPWRLYRTVELLEDRLSNGNSKGAKERTILRRTD